MAINFTDNRVNGFKYDKDGSDIQRHWDSQVPGLGVQVYSSGKKSWLFRYRIAGKQKIISFAATVDMNVDAARDKAVEFRAMVREGLDPKAAKNTPKAALTVQALFDQYIGTRYFQSRSEDYQNNFPSAIRKYLLPAIGDQTVSAVKRWQIRDVIESLIDQGKEGAARGLLTHTRILFKYALEREIIENSPADHIKPKYTTSGKRTDYLNDDQIKAAWWFKGSVQVRGMIRWMLLTGCRRDEARLITREDIADGIWTSADTKNGTDLILPVMPMMQAVIDEMTNTFGPSHILFQATTTHSKPIPRGSWHYQLKSNADFSAHELRHTVETHLAELSISEEYRDLILNHVRKSSGARYNHSLRIDAKRQVLEQWHNRLAEIIQ
jgi:integrase